MKKKKDLKFKRYWGFDEKTFNLMLKILEIEDIKKMKKGGRPSKLTVRQKLEMTLKYWRQYGTYFEIGQDFKITESVAYKNIIWVENTLIKSRAFALPNKQKVLKEQNSDTVVVDVIETRIERSKCRQKKFIRGRKKFTLSKHK